MIGNKILHYQKISSTNDIAKKLALSNAKEGCVIIAEEQTQGKGKLGRTWISPPYKNLYFSVILRPQVTLSESSCLTLLSALSIIKALEKLYKLKVNIKWPNDIIIKGRKIGGILTEIDNGRNFINFAIIGIGINVNMDKEDFPASLQKTASSLKQELGFLISKEEVLKEILKKLDTNYFLFKKEGFLSFVDTIKLFVYPLGKFIKIASGNSIFKGQVIDLDKSGALILRDENGFVISLLTGEIIEVK